MKVWGGGHGDVTPLLGMSDLPGGFIAAVMRNDTDLVTKMLDKEPMLLNAKAGYYETTALMAAADEGYLEMTRLLLERGADVNLVDRDGDTALVWAAMRGSQEVLSLILEAGASVDTIGTYTALQAASCNGQIHNVRLLLEHGKQDLNTTNNLGESALSLACHWCYGVVVKLLLLHGADCGPAVRWLESGDWRDEGVMEVLQWFEQEMVLRPYYLYRARSIQDSQAAHQRLPPPARAQSYLGHRASVGLPMPKLLPLEEASPRCVDAQKPEVVDEAEERAAVVSFLINELPQELLWELLQGMTGKGVRAFLLPG